MEKSFSSPVLEFRVQDYFQSKIIYGCVSTPGNKTWKYKPGNVVKTLLIITWVVYQPSVIFVEKQE